MTALEALAADHLQPAGGPLAEGVPGLGDAALELGRAPVGGALLDPGRGEEEGRGRAGEVALAGAELLPVGDSHGHAVGELVAEVCVDRLAHGAVAGDVDVGGGAVAERADLVVGDRAPVDAEALDELLVSRPR